MLQMVSSSRNGITHDANEANIIGFDEAPQVCAKYQA